MKQWQGDRNNAAAQRIIALCTEYRGPGVPAAPLATVANLSREGVREEHIRRFMADPPGAAAIARLLNYHFHDQTFAAVEKNGRRVILQVADGINFTPNTIIWEAPK